jgi:beta-N-acetylhexosaminidase
MDSKMDLNLLKQNPFYLDDEQINWVQNTKNKLSVEEKVGQLFCIIPGLSEQDMQHQMTYKPGGFMLRPGDTTDDINIVNYLSASTDVPLLLAADLEKGGNGVSNDGTTIGSPLAVAATDDASYASKLGILCAQEGAAVGVNWTFGPIVDIDRNFFNPITNVRTFGSNVDRIKKMGAAYVKAAQVLNVAASCKHFPGDGVDFRDQHIVGSTNSLSAEEWDETYGEVYRSCIEAGTMTIMIGHIRQPAWTRKLNPGIKDEEIMPATTSPEILQGLLRKHLGFNGIIVTDATTMTGFMQTLPRPQLVRQVFVAGADILLFSTNLDADFRYLLDGVKSGVITAERLDDAVTRILALKAALGLNKGAKKADLDEARKAVCDEGAVEHGRARRRTENQCSGNDEEHNGQIRQHALRAVAVEDAEHHQRHAPKADQKFRSKYHQDVHGRTSTTRVSA